LALTIRRATEKDDSILADFSRKTFEEAFGSENDPEDMLVYLEASFSLTKIASELTDPGTIFLLAYDNETLVGYTKLQEGLPPTDMCNEKAVELSRLYVVSHHMGKGFGSQLIQACVDEARQRGFRTIWLGVWEKNVPAQRLYERSGFVRTGSKTFVVGSDVQRDAVYSRSL
jgi:ribosomal protein S18 acetylase RimI-like enzyme